MSNIIRLLWIKILGTACFAAIPMLLAPENLYLWLGFPAMPTMLFLRLYGLSTLALLFGYYGGIEACREGQFPRAALRMGLVSNATQGAALLLAGALGVYASWGLLAQVMMWSLGGFIAGIAMAIGWALVRAPSHSR